MAFLDLTFSVAEQWTSESLYGSIVKCNKRLRFRGFIPSGQRWINRRLAKRSALGKISSPFAWESHRHVLREEEAIPAEHLHLIQRYEYAFLWAEIFPECRVQNKRLLRKSQEYDNGRKLHPLQTRQRFGLIMWYKPVAVVNRAGQSCLW